MRGSLIAVLNLGNGGRQRSDITWYNVEIFTVYTNSDVSAKSQKWGERGLSHDQMEMFALMIEQMLVSTAEIKTVETECRLLKPLDGG